MLKQFNDELPDGARIGEDGLDKNYVLSAFGRRMTAAWNLYGAETAGTILVQEAWSWAIELGYVEERPPG